MENSEETTSKADSQICVFDVTLKADVADASVERIKKWLKTCAKKWVFQLERGKLKTEKNPDGYLHYQIRLSLRMKVRKGTFIKAFNAQWGKGCGKVSVTSAENAKIMELSGKAFYCLKEDTREDGPWMDTDKIPAYTQKRFRDPTLKSWQDKLYQELTLNKLNDRKMILVVDPDGGKGKSYFAGYMLTHHDAVRCPSTCENAKQMMEYLCSHPKIHPGWHGYVLVDVPRATSEKHWWTISQGLEIIKQGFWYDGRNRCKEVTVEPPAMVAFCNKAPPEGTMSKDVFQLFEFPEEE